MNRRPIVIATVIAVALFATSASAQGFYVGAGIGNTFFSSEFEDATDQITKIDENSTAWKIFGGFSPKQFIGLEGGYRDFGTVETTVDGVNLESKTSGWDFELLGRFQISIIDIFGKAGVMFWSNDSAAGNFNESDSGTDFMWGLGAGARLGPIGVRLEWESVEVGGPDNLSMVSLGATFGF